MLPITYAVSSALAGSQCVVQAKSMSELFELIVTGDWGTIAHWFFWFNLVLLMIFLITWLVRMQRALGKYDPLFIIPLLQSFYILFSTITGGIYFQEFAKMGDSDFPVFFAGIGIMFFGLGLLAPTEAEKFPEMDESDSMKEDDDGGPKRCAPAEGSTDDDGASAPTAAAAPVVVDGRVAAEMGADEAASYFSDVLGPGALGSEWAGPKAGGGEAVANPTSTAELALSMALQSPPADDIAGDDDGRLTDGDDVLVTVSTAVIDHVPDSRPSGSCYHTAPRPKSDSSARNPLPGGYENGIGGTAPMRPSGRSRTDTASSQPGERASEPPPPPPPLAPAAALHGLENSACRACQAHRSGRLHAGPSAPGAPFWAQPWHTVLASAIERCAWAERGHPEGCAWAEPSLGQNGALVLARACVA